jgi:hypothetical protein
MHKWEHFGRVPAYFLAAALVTACGDGGDLLDITGVSDAKVELVAASGAKLSKQGEMPLTLKLSDAEGKPLANKIVTLTANNSNISLSTSSVSTDANGVASFKITGQIKDDLSSANNTGSVSATYTDEQNNKKTQSISYTIVDVSELQSIYRLEACFVPTAAKCESSAILKMAGSGASAKAEFTLYDSNDIAIRKPLAGKKVNFKLLKTDSASLSASSATTDANGKVSVSVFAAATQVASNSVIATVVDSNGVESSSTIGFDVISGHKVTFVANKTELLSGGDSVDLTALVVSASGNVQEKIPVKFSFVTSETGAVLKNADLSSNAEGKAKVTLELTNANGANLSNHTIQVRAAIGSGSDYAEELVNLNVVGTQVELTTANSSVKIGATPTITAVLKSGKGQAIANQTVTFTSSEIKDQSTGQFLNVTATTNSLGKVTLPFKDASGNNKAVLVVDKSDNGKATIKAAGLGTDSSLSFDVSERNFDLVFSKNGVASTEIDIRDGGDIELTLRDDTGAVLPDSVPVTVTTTLGKILPPTVLTKAAGGSANERKAKIRLTSDFPGTANVKASLTDSSGKQIEANGTVAFVSKIADKLAVQAVTPILAPNAQTNIIAKVRDVNDNPVKGVSVKFELENPLGGSLNSSLATTNDKGEAIVTFSAGSNDTGTEKIKVLATVPSEYTGFSGERNQTLNLTVGGEAVFIAIATGNVISEVTSTTYAVPHQVMVTDATGAPIANKEIKLSVWPVNYYKGFYAFSDTKVWVPQTTAECSNEDANQNGQMDSWENNKMGNALQPLDYPKGIEVDVEDNGDGKLWPGNPVTLSTSTVTTGANGIAYFDVLYGQSYASWLRVKLSAKAQVSGTESQADRIFRLSASSDDLTDEKNTPPGGILSAYGSATLCTDTN